MKFFTTIYALLLVYIVAALSFWWISLEKQSRIIYDKEVMALRQRVDSNDKPVLYSSHLSGIEQRRMTRSHQYMGEGLTFLVIILVGASIVYTTYRLSVKLSRQQNNFMLSVTHELKSPIAAMKLTLQTLRKHQLEEQKQQQLLDRCIVESDRLNELCNNILIASQMEGGQYKKSNERFDFSALVLSCLKDYAGRYPERFAVQVQDGIMIEGDQLLLPLAINNILENGIKYTPAGMPITVMLCMKDNRVSLQVADRGAGIPDTEKGKIFDKFYRSGDENTRRTKGTGLGLYLTKMIIRSQKGYIVVKDNKPGGSIFEITLPARSR